MLRMGGRDTNVCVYTGCEIGHSLAGPASHTFNFYSKNYLCTAYN